MAHELRNEEHLAEMPNCYISVGIDLLHEPVSKLNDMLAKLFLLAQNLPQWRREDLSAKETQTKLFLLIRDLASSSSTLWLS